MFSYKKRTFKFKLRYFLNQTKTCNEICCMYGLNPKISKFSKKISATNAEM